ncbi:MAG: DUF2149 domain-containing protein [Anaerovoracaceae bacterium]|jgi:hypothetical protein
MLRRFGTGRLRPQESDSEDVNPMSNIANLVDVMLVLAVGIMLALVMNWNLDISSTGTVPVEKTREVTNVKNIDKNDVGRADSDSGLSEMGTVYKDKKSGKLYMIVDK